MSITEVEGICDDLVDAGVIERSRMQ